MDLLDRPRAVDEGSSKGHVPDLIVSIHQSAIAPLFIDEVLELVQHLFHKQKLLVERLGMRFVFMGKIYIFAHQLNGFDCYSD